MTQSNRVYALDWMRVIAFALLMLYHTGMVFVGWHFHVMNDETLPIGEVMVFVNRWRLALLFAISGAGTWYALKNRNLMTFSGERCKRLFLPLVFGMLFIVPPQIYVEYLIKGMTSVDYLTFQGQVFAFVPYPEGGALSWHHLWFVLYLLVYSLISIPLFAYLRTAPGNMRITQLRVWLAKGGLRLWLPVLALWPVHAFLYPLFPSTHDLVGDWANHANYLIVFWLGLLFLGSIEIRNRLTQMAPALAVWALLTYVLYYICDDIGNHYAYYAEVVAASRVVYCWSAILAITGLACRYLERQNRFIAYANEAVYPFYILHQSVMMVLVYFVVPHSWNPWVKFMVVLIGMFAISAGLYELIIRRIRFLRPFFGLKTCQKVKAPVAQSGLAPAQ